MLEDESRFENVSYITIVETREVGGSSLIPRGRTKALSWSHALDLVLIDVKDEILMDEQNKQCLDADIINDSSVEELLTIFVEDDCIKDHGIGYGYEILSNFSSYKYMIM
ncbi:hypothetical protein PanWU01x14_240610 [Parasponia andersonii]|uniref:Uncharacterized protein n=1 Tax=Parasponia andersonii TaxID=3476 RepID=A0A2P5BGQ7_PARAD|nr:hypothetical protein PanWU01x14_240610 [Parasponia andersonii]